MIDCPLLTFLVIAYPDHMPVTPLVLLIYALAVARITGLITLDAITEPARDRVIGWLDDREGSLGEWLSKLITCPWCAGIWVTAAATPLIWWHGDNPWLLIPAVGLAVAQFVGMTSEIGR